MSLLVSVVFWNVMKIITSNDDGTMHLCRDNNTTQDLTTDGNVTNEWTFLVNVVTINGFRWCFESKTNFFIPSLGTFVDL